MMCSLKLLKKLVAHKLLSFICFLFIFFFNSMLLLRKIIGIAYCKNGNELTLRRRGVGAASKSVCVFICVKP